MRKKSLTGLYGCGSGDRPSNAAICSAGIFPAMALKVIAEPLIFFELRLNLRKTAVTYVNGFRDRSFS
jgi:hypothetical protein